MLASFAVMFALFGALAWVGWRFFYVPGGAADAGVSLKPTTPAASTTSAKIVKKDVRQNKKPMRWRRWWLWPLSTLAITALIMNLIMHMAEKRPPPAYRAHVQSNQQIELALTEEKLVPPPPLPPSVFLDSEEPSLGTADRDWGKLDPAFEQVVLRLISRMQARRYTLVLVEGYRSPARQEALANSGRNVTRAHGNESKHQFGLAADLAPMKDGRIVLSTQDPWALAAYQAMGAEAEALGLIWGGRWTFRDFGHVESTQSIGHKHVSSVIAHA